MLEGFFGTRYLMVIMLLACAIVKAQTSIADTLTVAVVNGESIVLREFMRRTENERSQVIRFFRTKHGCEYNNDFWDKTYDGETPTEVLKKKTIDTLAQIKIQQIEAKKWGIMPDISYQGFLRLLKKENKLRLEARSMNRVIYGPVQYSEEVYYNYLFTNMVNQLKDTLDDKIFNISDDKLREVYETDKDRLYRKGYYTKICLIGIHFKPGAGVEKGDRTWEEANSALIAISESINQEELSIGKAKEKYKNNPVLSLTIEDIIFNDSIYSAEEDNTARAMIKETAKAMITGENSPVMEFPDALNIFQVKEKRSLGYRNFEECKRIVRASVLDQMYLNYIKGLVLDADVQINMGIYQQIIF
jgi:hypothetical protein